MRKAKTFTIDSGLLDKLEKIAAKDGRNLSNLVETMCRYSMGILPDVNREAWIADQVTLDPRVIEPKFVPYFTDQELADLSTGTNEKEGEADNCR